ncbi:pro-resilin-like [Macrobrachium nipponense]|uniref:pro-resilin-like n=1 Tax=Macrobrachium nipponense TaxID=159736 RepID=UPI0030C8400F
MPYQFDYNVNDAYKGLNFGQEEHSDGKVVYGSYNVGLPDGRRQRVEYRADHQNGFVAKVNYVGEAQHPKSYGPAITFKPSYSNGNQGQGGNGFCYGGQGYGQGGSGFNDDGHGKAQSGTGFSYGGRGNGQRDNGFNYGGQGNSQGDNGYSDNELTYGDKGNGQHGNGFSTSTHINGQGGNGFNYGDQGNGLVSIGFGSGIHDNAHGGNGFSYDSKTNGKSEVIFDLRDPRQSPPRDVMMAIKTVATLLATSMAFVSSHPGYESAPMPYRFAYDVNDPYEGVSFGHREHSDGNVVTGFYNVALPDGRKQNGEYRVNDESPAQHSQAYGSAVTFRPSQNNAGQGQRGDGFGYGGQGCGDVGFGNCNAGLVTTDGGNGFGYGGFASGHAGLSSNQGGSGFGNGGFG